MVDRAGLENRCTGYRTVGSNPTPSASCVRLPPSARPADLSIGRLPRYLGLLSSAHGGESASRGFPPVRRPASWPALRWGDRGPVSDRQPNTGAHAVEVEGLNMPSTRPQQANHHLS